jgi:cation diffusion facilitator family transporter
VVNLLSAWILHRAGHHDAVAHDHAHHHGPSHSPHGHADLNLRAAYLHVLADAATSLLALVALLGGLAFGWTWLDPVMGIVGAALVAHWAVGLVRQTSRVLLDREMDDPVVDEVHEAIARLPGRSLLADLHLWRVGRHAFAGALSVVTHDPRVNADTVRAVLREHEELAHLTVEVHHCPCQGETHWPHPAG